MIASLDYGSQEPRLTLHFAYLAQMAGQRIFGADVAVAMFKENPRTDYHQMTADMCGIKRGPAKEINLGLGYGMGGAKLARKLGLPTIWKVIQKTQRIVYGGRKIIDTKWIEIDESEVEGLRDQNYTCIELAGPEAREIIKKWEEGVPFIKGLSKLCQYQASRRGYIVTIGGRRCRFPNYGTAEEPDYQWVHKSLNRLIQSSAADQTKRAMLMMWRAGIVPLLPIHDELVFSVKSKEEADSLAPYMVDAYTLSVPTIVDVKLGKTLGDIPK
jgi:DNA polymerase I-like protein with 3'-5' exonuclease and polymerase domains